MQTYRRFLLKSFETQLRVLAAMENEGWHHSSTIATETAYMRQVDITKETYERMEHYGYAKAKSRGARVPVPQRILEAQDNVAGHLAVEYASRSRAVGDLAAGRFESDRHGGDDSDANDNPSLSTADGVDGGDGE